MSLCIAGGHGARRVLMRSAQSTSRQQARWLSLHEYQSHDLLREYGIPVPKGKLASNAQQVKDATASLAAPYVLKSQFLASSRSDAIFDNGLKSGVQFAQDAKESDALSAQMLGHRLATGQVGGKAHVVKQVYVAESVEVKDKLYLAMTIDRENYAPVILASKMGGVDVKTIAKDHPESLFAFNFGLTEGITSDLVARIAQKLDVSGNEKTKLESILVNLHRIFKDKDATTLEINPLGRTPQGDLICLDAKFTFDDSAVHRQSDLFALRDMDLEVSEEVEAEGHGLVYVRMDGDIGNVVNGAGLAMATNDAVRAAGGRNANFLDAGGKATTETMIKAFGIVMRDERVKTIFVNIYGGLTNGVMIAESIIGAAAELGPIKVPVVVRIQGTNSAAGLKLLEEADLGLHIETDFGKAAEKAVEFSKA